VGVDVEFVRSARHTADLPRDGLAEVALVGRSNVGKSSLINALVRRRVARSGAAPGTTRLANVYRVLRGPAGPLYLVDLPGYGYARGGVEAVRAFDAVARAYFGQQRGPACALLVVDARHPGLASDRRAWAWLTAAVDARAIVAGKIDRLARSERNRALQEWNAVFDEPVLPVSAATGEGLDELWKLIDRLLNSRTPNTPRNMPRPSPDRTDRPQGPRTSPRSWSASTSRR